MTDKPDVSIVLITHALADMLTTHFPGIKVYNNPNQQDTELPAWFIMFMPLSGIKPEIGNRYRRVMGVDLVYLEEYNKTNLYDKYLAMAETLDENLDLLACNYEVIVDEAKGETERHTAYLHTYNREWKADLAEMHYQFRLEFRASRDLPDDVKMLVIQELTEMIKDPTQEVL